jgi:hypothetical protein
MVSGRRDDRLEAALETAMIVLKMRSRFSDGGISPSATGSALNFGVA